MAFANTIQEVEIQFNPRDPTAFNLAHAEGKQVARDGTLDVPRAAMGDLMGQAPDLHPRRSLRKNRSWHT
eukprot:2099133-Alexandrium_andersonii.AAC.1